MGLTGRFVADRDLLRTEPKNFCKLCGGVNGLHDRGCLNDVRNDMADLIDMATRQGRDMPLQEAYDKACTMHPQVSAVMAQRAQQEQLAGKQQQVATKKAAASSLRPGNPGGQTTNSAGTLYDALSAAWDEQVGR